MTKFLEVNDHLIQVPDDVLLYSDRMFDFLVYNGHLIITTEEGDTDIEGIYNGPFFVSNPQTGNTHEFANIELTIEFLSQFEYNT